MAHTRQRRLKTVVMAIIFVMQSIIISDTFDLFRIIGNLEVINH